MARKPRIHLPGGYYHVMIRGNGGQDIFFSDKDRTRFLLLVQEGIERYRHWVHCYDPLKCIEDFRFRRYNPNTETDFDNQHSP